MKHASVMGLIGCCSCIFLSEFGECHYTIYSADKRPRLNLISPKCYTKPLGGKMGSVKAIINLCPVVICYGLLLDSRTEWRVYYSGSSHTQAKLYSYRPLFCGATRWRSWLRHCATSRKVAGSNPGGVIGIFHWHNPSGHTMALGSTQPLTEMSTRNISWG